MALQSSMAFVPMREMQNRSHSRVFAFFLDGLRQGPVGVVESCLHPMEKANTALAGRAGGGLEQDHITCRAVPRLNLSAACTGPLLYYFNTHLDEDCSL